MESFSITQMFFYFTNTNFIEFHHLYISHVSPDDGLHGRKIIKTFVCVTEKPPHFYALTVYTYHGIYLMMAPCGPNMWFFMEMQSKWWSEVSFEDCIELYQLLSSCWFQDGSLLILILLFSLCPMWIWSVLLTLWMYMLLLMSTGLSLSLFSFTIRMGAVDASEKSTTLAICAWCNDPRAE